MTAQPELDFPSIDAEYTARRDVVSHDWRAEDDYRRFVAALKSARRGFEQTISQNDVRLLLLEETVDGPRCAIEHHRYSAFFSRARSERLIAKDAHDVCTTSPTGNNGRMQRTYRWTGGP